MSVLDAIFATARRGKHRICLSEGEDPRVVEAALRAARDGLAQVQLVGDAATIRARIGDANIAVWDPSSSDRREAYAQAYHELRKHKGVDEEKARAAMMDPLGFAAMAVRLGDADGTIGGAVATTSDTVRAALQIIGRAPDVSVVSSCFLMLLGPPHDRPVAFADCGLILQPTAEELASIALASADTLKALAGADPKVAMLSFSTKGSVPEGAHESLGRIREAIAHVTDRRPDLPIDGELQFDAAIMPEIGARKAPGSAVAGSANVFVFPSLSAGNIGYKIAQRIGGAVALGPILQGLAKPANDLSRGCSADDVYQMIAITAAQVR